MKKLILILSVFVIGSGTLFAQKSNAGANNPEFEKYCLKEAVYVIDVSKEKMADVEFAGELEAGSSKRLGNYRDYKIQLLENKNQYFKLNNSDKVLVARSLYTLRLNYKNSKK